MIDKYWNDVCVYSVVFQTDGLVHHEIHKWLIFPIDFTIAEIRETILTKFSHVACIVSIDEHLEGLSLKEEVR